MGGRRIVSAKTIGERFASRAWAPILIVIFSSTI
ncbi:unnamed protein product [Tenebrio molitor]|nr:unnamed protein product [Tenebrio molitor]